MLASIKKIVINHIIVIFISSAKQSLLHWERISVPVVHQQVEYEDVEQPAASNSPMCDVPDTRYYEVTSNPKPFS